MNEETMPAARARTPWHLWVVGVVSTLWNGFGVYDFICTKTQGEAYLRGAGFTDAQIAYYLAYPLWMSFAWALGVFGSLIGSLLLLLRSRYAFHAFVLSAVGFAINVLYTYVLSDGGGELAGQIALIMNCIIAVIILALIFYSRAMAKRGVLR